MTKNFSFITRLLFLASLLALAACQSSQSLVFSNQCLAPCWHHIEPGKTHLIDALSMIKNFSDVELNSISTSGSWNIFSGFVHFKLHSGEVIRVYAINDVVALIDIYNPKGITFKNCIDKFGKPEYAALSSILGPGIPILPASDAYHTWFSVINPSNGVVFDRDTYNVWLGSNFYLTQNTLISGIRFFDPKQYTPLLENGFLISSDAEEFSQKNLYPWKGYGDISKLYPEK